MLTTRRSPRDRAGPTRLGRGVAQQRGEGGVQLLPLGAVERCEDLVLDADDDPDRLLEDCLSVLGELDPVGAAVPWIAPADDAAGGLQLVCESHHGRAVDGEPFAEDVLGERALLVEGGEDAVVAGPDGGRVEYLGAGQPSRSRATGLRPRRPARPSRARS